MQSEASIEHFVGLAAQDSSPRVRLLKAGCSEKSNAFDSGSPARFFYRAKASPIERGKCVGGYAWENSRGSNSQVGDPTSGSAER